jgi:aminoglycoside phosphotransferase family enzyme/predicted kinase
VISLANIGQRHDSTHGHHADMATTTSDQSDVIAFLASPETHGVARVETIETHISMVFLAGNRAYKLKRAVRLPFVDFSTLERRRVACEAEVRVNRRTAPDIYLGAVPVTVEGMGFALDGDGAVADWVVVMDRFEQDTLFVRLARQGRLTPKMLEEVADVLVRLHREAEPLHDHGGYEGLHWVIEDNTAEFGGFVGSVFETAAVADYRSRTRVALARHRALLEARRRDGFVRRCHGDLHLGNICLYRGRPTVFDAIEFNDAIACCDVLYDMAFLIMDLLHRDLAPLANLVFNRYMAMTGDVRGLAPFGLFLSCRSAVRAKVAAIAATGRTDAEARRRIAEARIYLDEALAYLDPDPPSLVAVGGLSGSGKSTVAAALAPTLGAPPGALMLRSDAIRKRLFAKPLDAPLGDEGYTEDVNRRVYAALRHQASIALSAGNAVIVDATFTRPDERSAIADVARGAGVPFVGLWLDAPPATLRARLRDRRGDPSEATVTVLERQLSYDLGDIHWHRLDASGPPAEVALSAGQTLDRTAAQPCRA